MFKLIAQLYCNNEWQWLNIMGGGGGYCRDISDRYNDPGLQSYKKYAIKQIYTVYVVCTLI